MARINSNVSSLVSQANLNRANSDLEVRLQRLSTGLKINRGADDPAGLIVSERLRSEIEGLNQAVENSERASSVIATTEGSLAEVSDLLNSIRALVVEAANTGAISDEEREANQLQINSAIDSITRISNSASFGGLNLLNGELDYVLSGVDGTQVSKAQVFNANFAGASSISVDVQVIASAQTANLFLQADSGTFLSTATLEVAGPKGVQVLQFLSGTTLGDVATAISNFKAATGVSASLINPADVTSGLRFSSTEFGSDQFVSVRRLDGTSSGPGFFTPVKLVGDTDVPNFSFDTVPGADLTASSRDEGRDVRALVGGALANGKGLRVSLEEAGTLSLSLELASTFASVNGSTTSFAIVGGGALYQLGGQVTNTQQVNLGIQSIAASRLGGTLLDGELQFLSSLKSGGTNDLNSRQFADASQILDTAIDEISTLRGRLGAFERNTLQTNIRSLSTAVENLTASESRIRDADFAAETSALSRAQVLSSAATSVLALANQQTGQVLQLLG